MNPKIKLLIVVAVSTLTLTFGWNPLCITPIFFLVLTSIFLFKVYRKLLGWLKFLVVIGLLIILIQTFTYSGFGFSLKGLIYGIIFSLRFLTLILLVFVFVHTTPTRRLVEAFSFLPHPISFMLMLSLSLLPKMESLVKVIINAQKTRGLNFKTLNIFKVYPPILIPLISKTLEKSQQLALTLQTRGFE